MCGIAGYWGTGSREILEGMERSLVHRGPDDGGILELGPVGLAHRRLSIVDLSPAGHQPMSTARGNVSLVFNGEIYNHKELRERFLNSYTFRGTSDTEVLLYLYEELGDRFLEQIQGMFAVALYDREKGKLLLARDRIGKKPLYWTLAGGTLLFGSELKALRAHPLCSCEIDRDSLAQYLLHEYVPSPRTIYAGVSKLPPGSYLVYDGREVTLGTYHSFTPALGTRGGSFSSAVHELDELLKESVATRMVADVPVGVFLSGGLDSSTIAHFAQQAGGERVKTFSIGFEESTFDERVYAREVATLLGTEHHERLVTSNDLQGAISRLPDVLDEPMADSSIIPTLLLSELTAREVKVVLGGDGADELFWGYDTFFAHRVGEWYEWVSPPVRRAIRAAVGILPVSHAYMSLDFKLKKFVSGFDVPRARRNAVWLGAFTPEELETILEFPVTEGTLFAASDSAYAGARSFWDGLQRDYLTGYLAEDILVKTDRAGMAHGLEVRAPFLDTRIVDFALTLSAHDKHRGRTGKYILKELMKEHLPQHIVMRKKKGFNIPIGAWIRGDLRELFTDTILHGALAKSGLFNRTGLAMLVESHIAGREDNRKKLWTLFVLALWMEKWHEQH